MILCGDEPKMHNIYDTLKDLANQFFYASYTHQYKNNTIKNTLYHKCKTATSSFKKIMLNKLINFNSI